MISMPLGRWINNHYTYFKRFTLIGAVGFVVDGGLLTILFHLLNIDPIISRVFSFGIAASATWLLNRRLNFHTHLKKNKLSEWRNYLLATSAGASINFVIYVFLISSSILMAEYPLLPFAIGSAIALLFNYFACREYVFKDSAPGN